MSREYVFIDKFSVDTFLGVHNYTEMLGIWNVLIESFGMEPVILSY